MKNTINFIPPVEVSELLLGPQTHHLARVTLAVATAEAELTSDVAVAILEYKDGCLEHLDGTATAIVVRGMVHIGFLARADASVNLFNELSRQHLEQDHARAGIKHLNRVSLVIK